MMNPTRICRTAVIAAAIALSTAGIATAAAPDAAASTPPTYSVSLFGTDSWAVSWNGFPATSCHLVIGPISDSAIGHGALLPILSPVIKNGPGAFKTFAECGGKKSNVITIYSPRNFVNDMRTQFSNATEGMFGS